MTDHPRDTGNTPQPKPPTRQATQPRNTPNPNGAHMKAPSR